MSVKVVKPNVVLLKTPTEDKFAYSGKAAKFCTSPDEIHDIISSSDASDKHVLKKVIDYGHLSVTEFDFWIFGVENVSRTLTHQLVRKRLASYAQESMRYASQAGEYKIIVPKSLENKVYAVKNGENILCLSLEDLADISHQWYEEAQKDGVPNEDARFALLEASKTKIMIGMNTHALLDFFNERCCNQAQWEIRFVAKEMLKICKTLQPEVFKNAGSKCVKNLFCREPVAKWEKCKFRKHENEVKSILGVE